MKSSCLSPVVLAMVGLLTTTSSVPALKCVPYDIEGGAGSGGGSGTGQSTSVKKKIAVEILDKSPEKPPREIAWLGISTLEASEALASQLGLQPGDGLVVSFVEAESPAAKAGLQKNDVLVSLGDQLLVHPLQFRKLVRRHKEGDTIKLTLYRGGKKQTASATLTKTMERAEASDEMNHGFQFKVISPKIYESLGEFSKDKPIINLELRKEIEEARSTLHEALSHNSRLARTLGPEVKDIESLIQAGVGKSSTVTVKKDAKTTKTIVKADETGTLVIVANPKKRLTIHDKDGKLVFDEEIDTEEQLQKVPAELVPKVRLMLKEMGPVTDDRPKSHSLLCRKRQA